MNNEMAYLLGLISGNGEIQRGPVQTMVSVEIPHKKMETEFERDVKIYVKASVMDIRTILEPLLGAGISFTQNPKVSILSFTKPGEDYLIREILRYVGSASTHENMRISPEVFDFTADERLSYIRGFADVTGYIRRSNAFIDPHKHRVYIEVPHNWRMTADFCRLLASVDIPVQNIDWAHPNMRDGELTKYNQGKKDFWKKEHQIKIYVNEFERVGFAVIHKNEALRQFAEELRQWFYDQGRDPSKTTHRYYWESPGKRRIKPHHPGENDAFIPEEIRGKHYDSWREIAGDLGYKES